MNQLTEPRQAGLNKAKSHSMKRVRSAADLAVNGAPPAFPGPLHVGRPNVGNRDEFMRLAGEMFDRRWLSNNGPLVQDFERQVEGYLGVKHCVAMCNGTIALEIAIRALGLEGEVIVPSYTFIATAHALHWQGITPVFADIDPTTHNLDPESVRRMITPRTTGIIAVHLWGRSAPVAGLQSLANEYGLQLMFDSAHAFGCSSEGKMIGGFGRAEVLSFHATKFFNSFEGGAVVTDDGDLAEAMRLMRNFGFAGLDNVVHPGTNGKMTEVCAAMGLANFSSIGSVVDSNRRNYHAYRNAMSDVPGVTMLAYDEAEKNNYQYVVLQVGSECAVGRDEIITALRAENVLARKYFWPGCHLMEPYRSLYPHAGMMLPNTLAVARSVVVLPTGPSISESDCGLIAEIIATLVASGTGKK